MFIIFRSEYTRLDKTLAFIEMKYNQKVLLCDVILYFCQEIDVFYLINQVINSNCKVKKNRFLRRFKVNAKTKIFIQSNNNPLKTLDHNT